MSAPWELQGFNPQHGTTSSGSGTGQIKLFNPASFQNQQVRMRNRFLSMTISTWEHYSEMSVETHEVLHMLGGGDNMLHAIPLKVK